MELPEERDLPQTTVSSQQDLPIVFQELTIKDRPEDLDAMYRGHAAALKAELEEESVFSAYSSVDPTEDPRAVVGSLSVQRSQEEMKGLEDYFNANLGNTPEEIADNIEVFQSLMAEEEAAAGSPERQVVAAMSGLEPNTEEVTSATAELKLINTIDDITRDYSLWEKVKDFGKSLIPGTALLDNSQVTEGINPFEADDYLRDIVIGMKDLRRNDPEKFNEILPVFEDRLKETLPKNKQVEALAAILNPAGEEDLDSFGDFGVALDTADAALIGLGTLVALVKSVRKMNSIRMLSKLDNVETASDVNASALIDDTGEVARNAGIDPDTAYSNASPFKVDELDEAYAEGVSSASLERINRVKEHQRQISQMIRSENGFLREDILTPTERLAAEDKFVADMKVEGIEDISVSSRSRDATTFEYKKVDPTTNEVTVANAKLDLKLSDITGTWQHTEEGMTAAWIKSPTVFAKNSKDAVNSALRLDSTSAVVREGLQRMQTEALAPILGQKGFRGFRPKARRELMELDEVLRAGDEYTDATGITGKTYSPDELRGGVVNGIQLNDRQIESYYNLRGLYDELWTIRNDETRRALVSQGKREITVSDSPNIGKSFDQQGAIAFVNQRGTVKAYDASKGEIVDISGKDLSSMYEGGLALSRLDNAIKPDEFPDELFDLVVTHSDRVTDLPQKVLHFREGYVPKINKNANWFVKELGDTRINGVTTPGKVQRTVRMFASRVEAERWLKTQDNADKLTLLPDRAVEQEVLGSPELGSGGGLYTGARSRTPIPFGPDGDSPERLNTFEALNTNIQSLENYVSRNQWRMAQQQKWINSARAAGFDIDTFEKALIPEGDPRGKGLRKLAEQIEIWSGFPTQGELAWDGFVSGVMEWALKGTKNKKTSDLIVRGANFLRDRGNDPVSLARNTAFHSLLGVFNPSQLWVQAQGASLAASLSNSPLKTFRMQNALAVASKFGTDSKAFEVVAKASAVDVQDLKKLTQLWKRTGLEASTLNTADHAAAAVGVGTTRAALRKVFDKGLLLYRAGELFNRRYSFLVAAERFQRKTGKSIDSLNDADLKEMLVDANNMMLNLSKANRAAWQRGVVSVPTQFLQVQAKFLETLVGANKAFTVRERGRILAGQMVLYGSAGIPLGSLGVRWAQESLGFSQKDLEEAPPEVITAINEGMWGVFAKQWLGVDVDLSNRGAIAAGMTDFTFDLMFSEASLGEKAVGAFGMVPHRSFQAWKTIKPMLMSDTDIPMTKGEFLLGLNSLASVTSTWNNVQKGWFMARFNQLNDTRGNLLIEGFDFSTETEVMTMLGFQPSEIQKVADREALVRSRKEYRIQVTSSLLNHYWDYVQVIQSAETDKERDQIIERYRAGTLVLLKSLRNEGERDAVRESMQNRILNGQDRRSKAIREFIETFADGQVLAKGSFVEAATASGIITNDLELPEEEEE